MLCFFIYEVIAYHEFQRDMLSYTLLLTFAFVFKLCGVFFRAQLLQTVSPLSYHKHLLGHCPWSWCYKHMSNRATINGPWEVIACWLSYTVFIRLLLSRCLKEDIAELDHLAFHFLSQRYDLCGACPYSLLWRNQGPRHFFTFLHLHRAWFRNHSLIVQQITKIYASGNKCWGANVPQWIQSLTSM